MRNAPPTDPITKLADEWAFAGTTRPEMMGKLHVPFDTLTGTAQTEDRLARCVAHGRRVVLQSGSGEGKSSVMAAVLEPIVANKDAAALPLWIKVPIDDMACVGNSALFLKYTLGQILKWAAPRSLDRGSKRALRKHRASLRDRQVTKHAGLSVSMAGITPEMAQEVTTTITAIEDYGDALGELNRVVELFEGWGKQAVFVFDDTDTWLEAAEFGLERRPLATGFFNGPLRKLAKEVHVGVVLAAHPSYAELREYQEVCQLFDMTIPVPRLDDQAVSALEAILERRIRHALSSDAAVLDYVEREAIESLAKYYRSKGGQNLRSTLRVASGALELAREAASSTVTAGNVAAALGKELG